ncbi:MAG: hypothetical protein ACREJG_05035 [Candidatus Rokuibacteriota bacterium]
MMPDNWGYVAAAYGLAVVVFGGYWRYLVRRDRELTALLHRRGPAGTRVDRTPVERHDPPVSVPAHARPEPGRRPPRP